MIVKQAKGPEAKDPEVKGSEAESPEKDAGKRTIILGVGNTLLSDEGIGVYVANEMRALSLPEGVEIIDGATAGYDLIYMLEGASKVIVIDAVDAEAEPGTVFRFTPDDAGYERRDPRYSVHDVGLLDAVQMAKALGTEPEVVIIGVQPKLLDWGLEPTDELRAKVPEIIELVLQEIEKIG